MIYLNSKPVLKWLYREGKLYVIETETWRGAVELHQLGADEGYQEILTAAHRVPRS